MDKYDFSKSIINQVTSRIDYDESNHRRNHLLNIQSSIQKGEKNNFIIITGTNDNLQRVLKELEENGTIRVTKESYSVKLLQAFDPLRISNHNLKENHDYNYPYDSNGRRKVITERDVLNINPTKRKLIVPEGSIITSLAYDRAKELNIEIVRE